MKNTPLGAKNLSHVNAVKYGIENKENAARRYVNHMKIIGKPVKTFECGIIISIDILTTLPQSLYLKIATMFSVCNINWQLGTLFAFHNSS